tara:strand:+ start:40 stop:228 length:189 start_codon:yes stop_codon:yes gene_type:complete
MDAQEYDKIVDKLLQFRGKIPVSGICRLHHAKVASKNLRVSIDNLLEDIEKYAELDILGWIK